MGGRERERGVCVCVCTQSQQQSAGLGESKCWSLISSLSLTTGQWEEEGVGGSLTLCSISCAERRRASCRSQVKVNQPPPLHLPSF